MSTPERRLRKSEPELSVVSGLPFHQTTMEEALADFVATVRGESPAYWVTANVDFATRAVTDPLLKDLIYHADRIFCDGLPLVWLSKWFGRPLPERVAGSDMVPLLLERSAKEGIRVYFLGSDEPTLAETSRIALERYPELQIAGHHAPPFAPVHQWDNEAILEDINTSKPDLILVAVGSPKQERWISGYLHLTGAKLAVGIGASLDFIAGSQTRAPRWIQIVGFEWLWRMLTDPKRLAKRYGSNFSFHTVKGSELSQLSEVENDLVIDLSETTSITPELLANLTKVARHSRRGGHLAPAIDASPPLLEALTRVGLVPPLEALDRGTSPAALIEAPRQPGDSHVHFQAPSHWRRPQWSETLEALPSDIEAVYVDLSNTSTIDFPTLLKLNHLKDVLDNREIALKMNDVTPALEGLLKGLGFSRLLAS